MTLTNTNYFALHWWSNLSQYSREELAKKYFPHMPFVAVTKSTGMVRKIYLSEKGEY